MFLTRKGQTAIEPIGTRTTKPDADRPMFRWTYAWHDPGAPLGGHEGIWKYTSFCVFSDDYDETVTEIPDVGHTFSLGAATRKGAIDYKAITERIATALSKEGRWKRWHATLTPREKRQFGNERVTAARMVDVIRGEITDAEEADKHEHKQLQVNFERMKKSALMTK